MLNQVSWTSFCKVVILLLVIYYLYLAIRYFREDLKAAFYRLWANRAAGARSAFAGQIRDDRRLQSFSSDPVPQDGEPAVASHENGGLTLDDLIKELKTHIASYDTQAAGRLPIAIALKSVIARYSHLKHSRYRPAINEMVASDCEKAGIGAFTAEEVDHWWPQDQPLPANDGGIVP